MLLLVAGSLFWLTQTSPDAPKYSFNDSPQHTGKGYPAAPAKPAVTVDDIIAKLRAKSLMPPLRIDAPVKLAPLAMAKTYFSSLADAMPVLYPELPADVDRKAAIAAAKTNGQEPFYTSKAIGSFQQLQQAPRPALTAHVDPPATALEEPDQQLETSSIVKLSPTRRKRWSVMMSFAPAIGYRKLYDGNQKSNFGNSPVLVQRLNVNEFVDHQPAIGFEFGGAFRYEASRSLVLKTGLQLNLTRYTIEAFAHTPEKATLTLNTAYGYQNDTLVATSNMRNFSGIHPERLQNQYLQIALPIGAELKLFGYSKFQVNLAGSLQPSYLLNANQYLLSSDFTNYVKEPSLIRRWNVATSIEAFFSYQSGDLRWQLGPQFRYNLLSTYKKEYPIKENLMEYGVKVGISKTIR
ncbi:hypothetical protein FPE01S_04_03600 [Flavihumibacter petaseus NBRC 106054]|uniref:Outer membrane protein beta-barrel domain-containing protein n=2 Tax=Flavihumibacter TaxID=1004301 RepID=A0A0E9N579_9BACT|nr:hypothetical protein FPE01S_04_03600 [Flavihumibacter petaseus NBRC 106054]